MQNWCVRAAYLRCGEEEVLADVAHAAGSHPQADAREDVGVVALARVEGPAVGQRDWVERAAAGEDASTLHNRTAPWDSLLVPLQSPNQTHLQAIWQGIDQLASWLLNITKTKIIL